MIIIIIKIISCSSPLVASRRFVLPQNRTGPVVAVRTSERKVCGLALWGNTNFEGLEIYKQNTKHNKMHKNQGEVASWCGRLPSHRRKQTRCRGQVASFSFFFYLIVLIYCYTVFLHLRRPNIFLLQILSDKSKSLDEKAELAPFT